jgi:alpha-D-xyloside xylohydrolase
VGSREDRPDYDYGDGVTLQVYQLADGADISTPIPALAGNLAATFVIKREDRTITVERQGTAKNWRVLLVGIEAIESVEGGAAESSPQGLLVASLPDGDRLKILLNDVI